jgi:hypothetical protein
MLICFLTSTTGLNLIEHYCSSKERSYVFLFAQPGCDDHDCAPVEEKQSCPSNDCCSDEETTSCCQDFSKFIKLVADYFSNHSKTNTDCPVFVVEHSFDVKKVAFSVLSDWHVCVFCEDVGMQGGLLIKRTTELLL